MADNDDLEDVELNYLRDQALISRQNPVQFTYPKPPLVNSSFSADVNLDMDIFKPTGGGSNTRPPVTEVPPSSASTSRQSRKQQHKQTEILETFNNKINSKPASKSSSTRANRSPSSSSSTSASSYSSQYSQSYSSSRSGSGSRSRSTSRSKSSSSQSTYSTGSNDGTPARARSRSPTMYHHQPVRRHHNRPRGSLTPPPSFRGHYERPSRSHRRGHHSPPVEREFRGVYSSSTGHHHHHDGHHPYPVPSSPHSRSRASDRHRGPPPSHPPPSRRAVHRSPQWRSMPSNISRRTPPRRTPPPPSRRTPPPHSSRRRSPGRLHPSPRIPPPRSRRRDLPPHDLMHGSPPPRGPSRRRHSMSPPHSSRRRPSPMGRHRSPPSQRRIRMSPPPYSPSSPPRRMRDHNGSRRDVDIRNRERDMWAESRARDPPHHRGRERHRELSKREREIQSHEALELWRKRKREEQEMKNGENARKRRRRKSSSIEGEDKYTHVNSKSDTDYRRSGSPDSVISDDTGSHGNSSSQMLEDGKDVMDEELDYDETMEGIEQYLREDDSEDQGVLKSEVVPRRMSRMSESSITETETAPGIGMKPDPSKPYILSEDELSDNDDLLQEDTQTMERKESQETQKDSEEDDLISNKGQENINEEELSTEEGEVLPQSSEDDEVSEDEEKEEKDTPKPPLPSDEVETSQPISSPIRLTPERQEGRTRRRGAVPSKRMSTSSSNRVGTGDGQRRERSDEGGDKPRLPVRDRLYLSKTDIERKTESINYRQHHKLSSDLARRLGPPSNKGRKRGPVSSRVGVKSSTSRGDAKAIAEEYRRKQQKKNVPLPKVDQDVQREKRRISKLLLNDQHRKGGSSSHRYLKDDEGDLDQKINKIRSEDKKRLMRQEEVRKDRQRYG